MIDYFTEHTEESKEKGNGFRFTPTTWGYCKSNNHTRRTPNGR